MKIATLLGPVAQAARRLVGRARKRPVRPQGQRARAAGAVVLAALAVGSGTGAALDHAWRVPDGAAYRLADRVVTVAELDGRVRLLGVLYGVQAPSDPAELDRFRRDTARALAVSDVLDRAAAEEGVVIADKAASDELTRLLETAYPQGRADFLAQLGAFGITEAAVLDEVGRQLATGRLYDSVTAEVPVPTDDEVAGAFTERRAEMVTPERRGLRNIVVDSEAAARAIRARLDAGEDFAAVAREVSLDASTRDQGGDLGTVIREQLEVDYGAAAFGAAANGLFGPVQTRYGWNVGQALEITPSTPLALEQVRDPLRTRLLEERRSVVWNDWLAGRIADADVRYADDYRPADPDAPASPAG